MVSFLRFLINGISLGSVYAIIARGSTMVYGIAKMLNFAHGDVIMIGAYIAFCGLQYWGIPPVLAILLAMVFCTLLGHSVFSWDLKYESPAFISTVKLLEPVFAGLLGVLLFKEIPKTQVILGGCTIILGVYVYSIFSESRGDTAEQASD